MNFRLTAVIGAVGALAVASGIAQAATQYDADLAAPGVYFGSGNSNGHFTIETVDGVELGLRGKQYQQPPTSPSGSVYNVGLGQTISFDWSFNPGADGSAFGLQGLTSLMTITNVGTGGSFSLNPFLVPDNETDVGAPGGHQNSWRLSFAFLNGPGGLGYNANTDATYEIAWSVDADAFGPISNKIYIDQGAGFVPEPSTWAIMILGFGAAGVALRRRRTALA